MYLILKLMLKILLTDIHITRVDMLKRLKTLKINKSPGPDELHPRILRELANEISYPLKLLFDKNMNEGKLHFKWKLAEVIPLFKKGCKSTPCNYRPVSLTSVVCTVFEGFVRDSLYNLFIEK